MPRFRIVVKYPNWMQCGGITQTYCDTVESETLGQAIMDVQDMAARANLVDGDGPSADDFEFLGAEEIKGFAATYIDAVATENTGGGCMVDFVYLKSGGVIGITDDSVVLYSSREAFDKADSINVVIWRPNHGQ